MIVGKGFTENTLLELLAYLSYRAPKLGYRCIELPPIRRHPASGQVPTKISNLSGNVSVLQVLVGPVLGLITPCNGLAWVTGFLPVRLVSLVRMRLYRPFLISAAYSINPPD